jgi:hypothetical protein
LQPGSPQRYDRDFSPCKDSVGQDEGENDHELG